MIALALTMGLVGAPAPRPIDEAPSAAVPAKTGQRIVRRGRRIDVELQAVDVRAVFPTLAEIGRVNFVLEGDVEGKVTAFLEDVTWEEATYWICRAMHLRARRSGNVIYISRQK